MAQKKERKFAKDFLDKWTRAEREEGPADEALQKVDEVLKDRPDDPALWFRRGTLLLDLERWEEAAESLRRVESLDPQFARLYVALAFVLGKLGRLDEAVAAQRQAVAAAGGREPPAAEGLEEAFATLTEDLLERAAEERAVAHLRELEETEEEDVEAKLRAWEADGYDVGPLREVFEKEPDRARTAMFQFEQNVRKVQILRDTVDALSTDGIEDDIARVRTLFRAPYQIWKIEAEMATLLEKADTRDRAQRARTAPSPAGPPRAGPRGVGGTNGRTAMPGRVNGLAAGTGRVNGQVAGTGRVNGLINGVHRARAGLTNGLTNGVGITNGLGGSRFAAEARARRWRLLVVPIVALALLSVPLFVSETRPTAGGIQIDGRFDDWRGIPGYAQPTSTGNANADLATYRVDYRDGILSVYASVRGSFFGDPQAPDLGWIFLDTDGNPATGYDDGRVGADLLVTISGNNGTVDRVDGREWVGTSNATDRQDWNGWGSAGVPAVAASAGSELEAQLDLSQFRSFDADLPFNASEAAVSIALDDQQGSRSASDALAGPSYGALVVQQTPLTTQIAASPSDVLKLTFHAIGATVTVSGLSFDRGPNTPPPSGFAPLTIPADSFQNVTMQVDGSSRTGDLLTAALSAVTADRPVTIFGGGARVYVGTTPTGPTVDGLFGEWTAWLNDTDAPAVRNPNVDIVNYASEAPTPIAFTYVRMRGDALAGASAPEARVRPPPTGGASAPSPPTPLVRRVGEDLVQVYYQSTGSIGGFPIDGIAANALLEVRGRYGRVTSARSFLWSGNWQPSGTANAIAVGNEFESSVQIPSLDLRGADFVVRTQDWRLNGDVTAAGGVRGTRSGPSGTEFVGSYDASLPSVANGSFRFEAPGGFGIGWRLPDVAIDRGITRVSTTIAGPAPLEVGRMDGAYRGAYPALGIDVAYEATFGGLKETFTLASPPILEAGDLLAFDFPLVHDAGLMTYASGVTERGVLVVDGTLSFVDGRGLSIDVPVPWIADAHGRRLDLPLRLGTDFVRIQVPADWLAGAAYPIVLDPTTTYTLQDNGPTYKKGENLGFSVAVGDFNGDGVADVLTGAPAWGWGTHTNVGYAYIYYGPFTADQTAPNVRFNGTTIDTGRFGFSVAAGKFNGDSYWDALISHVSTGGITGPVDIFFGSGTLSGDVSAPDVKFEPPASPSSFGYVVGGGNVDNANSDDVLIAEPGRDNNGDSTGDGVVYLYKSPFASDVTTANYTLLPSTNGGGQLGRGGIAVGMVDSDAYPDVVLGEPFTTNGGSDGRVQFYKGSDFLSGSGNRSPDATLSNQSSGERFGGAVAVGLLNGDAYADIVVGAPLKSSGNGAAYIFLANNDGSGITTGASPSVTLPSQSSGENFGSALLVLDLYGTGTAGVAVGAPLAAGGGTARGSVYVFKTPLTSSTPDDTLSGSQNTERFGAALAGEKFASDAKAMLAIGAYLWDKNSGNPNDNDGRVVVASVPEPGAILAGGVVILGLTARSLQRRRLVRKRRELRLQVR